MARPRPRQLAAFSGVALTCFEAVPIGETHGKIHVLGIAPAVVEHADSIAIGHRPRPHQIASAQGDAINAELLGRDVDEPLERKRDLRPAGTAIGLGRCRIGEDRHGPQGRHRNIVAAGDQPGALAQRRQGDAARADIADIGRAQGQKPSALIEGKFKFCHQVSALVVADKTFRTRGGVFNRTAELAGGPKHQAKFDIDTIARAKISADIVGQYANSFGVDSKDGGELAFLPHRAAAAGINRVALRGFIVVRHRCTRLHRRSGHPADVKILSDDMGGIRQDSISLRRMPEAGIDQDVVGGLVPDRRGVRLHGVFGVQNAR